MRLRRVGVLLGGWLLAQASFGPASGTMADTQAPAKDPRLARAWRFERDSWVYLHLEGRPAEMGFQHGYLLAPEIEDAWQALRLQDTRRTKRDSEFFRTTARELLWPGIEAEYRQELEGLAAGLAARGVAMDVWDVVALNGFEEVPDYYVPWLDKQQKTEDPPKLVSPGNCSAFVATGSYTKGGGIVMAHNAWTSFVPGARWRIVFDIVPERGHRILMDGFPGVIASDDDFGVNAAGLMITETTITGFSGFDPKGKPEFVRARKAMQYASSIDEFVAIMLDGNNGGYANDWLVGDRKTGEIAQLELGLQHHRLWRTKDGYFVGSNFPSDPEVTRDETSFDASDKGSSPNARRARWEQLMAKHRGRIDVAAAQAFLADHFDLFLGREEPNERTLCGHVHVSPRGIKEWEWGPYHPGGAVQGKATDSRMTEAMSFRARRGFPCGADFDAAAFLAAHPEYEWQRPVLPDMKAGPWATFAAGDRK